METVKIVVFAGLAEVVECPDDIELVIEDMDLGRTDHYQGTNMYQRDTKAENEV